MIKLSGQIQDSVSMLKKDHFLVGLSLGIVFPAIAYALVLSGNENIINNKPLALYALAALFNLLIARYFSHYQLGRSARGIVLITFLLTLILLIAGDLKISS